MAVLKWLRSPWKEPVSGMWITTAVFTTNLGEVRELNFPWQDLPLLKLGWVNAPVKKRWRLGRLDRSWSLTGKPPIGRPLAEKPFLDKEMRLEVGSTIKYCCAAEIPELKTFLPPNPANFYEQCITITSPQGLLVIPTIECIRAFLAGHSQLAEGVLEPNYIERIVTNCKVISRKLELEFSTDILAKHVSQPLIIGVAQLLCDASFRKSWNQIYYNRRLHTNSSHWYKAIPLTTELPQTSKSWHIRTVAIGKVNLVLEIISAAPLQAPGFNTIEYTHPRLRKSFYEYRLQQRGIYLRDDQPLILERFIQLSKNTQSENALFNFFQDSKIKIIKRITT